MQILRKVEQFYVFLRTEAEFILLPLRPKPIFVRVEAKPYFENRTERYIMIRIDQ